MCCWTVADDVFPKGGYGGLDVAIQGVQLERLLGCQVLDTGYCSMSVLNLGNWGVVTYRIQ